MRSVLLIVVALGILSGAQSPTTLERKYIMVQLCRQVVDQYTAHLAEKTTPTNRLFLEREFERCNEVINEYEDLVQ